MRPRGGLLCDLGSVAVDALRTSPSPRTTSEVYQVIAERVAALVPKGATPQIGIGAVPGAVLAALTGRQCLPVWPEMVSDAFTHRVAG